jgi:hypothetical protein
MVSLLFCVLGGRGERVLRGVRGWGGLVRWDKGGNANKCQVYRMRIIGLRKLSTRRMGDIYGRLRERRRIVRI